MTGRKERFVIIEGAGITSESEDPDALACDVAEINAKYGTDAQVVFDQLARRLEKRVRAAVKANLKDRGGRPKGSKSETRMKKIRVDLLKQHQEMKQQEYPSCKTQSGFARYLRIPPSTLQRAFNGHASPKTIDTMAKRLSIEPQELIR